MNPLLYYLPKVTEKELLSGGRLNRALLASLGLAESWADVDESRIRFGLAVHGPDGGHGLVTACETLPRPYAGKCGYAPDVQEWHDCGGVWVGWRHECHPDEEGLRRRVYFASYSLQLNGSAYMLPILRRQDGTTELPCDVLLGPYREEVKPKYRSLWERSAQLFDDVLRDEVLKPDYDRERGVRFAIAVVGLNYRYGLVEHNALRLVDRENWRAVVAHAVDILGVEALLAAKKKAGLLPAESPSSQPGAEES